MNQTSDILIIGGGIIGLSLAIELKQRGATVTIANRDFKQAASHAAAGMLAPSAEALPPGPMQELCLKSLWLYSDWISKLERISGLDAGYWPCGILAPAFSETPSTQQQNQQGTWLDKQALAHIQKGLGPEIVGGWWYPEDAQVDNRSLIKALLQAAQSLGVKIKEAQGAEAIQQKQGRIVSVKTTEGEISAETYVLATGAWSNQLLPFPVHPVKGQMLCLRMPWNTNQPLPIERVLYGDGIYLVPRKDGRLIVGATTEEVGWRGENTPFGLHYLLQQAMRVYPGLESWSIEETWWGFRPQTPDSMPILGNGPSSNLVLATGHYRNGILLAPVTTYLLADLITEKKIDPLLTNFNYQRFYQKSQTMLTVTSTPSSEANLVKSDSPSDELIIAGRRFQSRLMTGTGKYPSIETMQESVIASGCQIITVAVRRVQTKAPGHEGLAQALDWSKIWMLPNTAGCQTAEEAIRVARLGREMAKLLGQEDNNFIKLEVIPDSKYLLPDPIGTLQAAEVLVKEGFAVLPYINADPLLAKRLEEVGCATVMPLGSPIGSGQGIKNAANIAIIIEQASVPVVIDAGIGTPSEAALGMELGADALLINSAIALAKNPVSMARAMGLATEAGRLAYLAGRMPLKHYASASSPQTGLVS